MKDCFTEVATESTVGTVLEFDFVIFFFFFFLLECYLASKELGCLT